MGDFLSQKDIAEVLAGDDDFLVVDAPHELTPGPAFEGLALIVHLFLEDLVIVQDKAQVRQLDAKDSIKVRSGAIASVPSVEGGVGPGHAFFEGARGGPT